MSTASPDEDDLHPQGNITVRDRASGSNVLTSRMMLDLMLRQQMTGPEFTRLIDGMNGAHGSAVAAMASSHPFFYWTPQPLREMFLAGHELMQAAMTAPAKIAYQHFASREAAERALLSNPQVVDWLSSRAAAQWMWREGVPPDGGNEIVGLNDRLYTHNPDRSLNRIRSADIVKHFPPGQEEHWPRQLVLTSNHARTRGHEDVSGIMHHISTLLRHALPGKIDLARRPDEMEVGEAAGKTIVVTAVHAEESDERNGADLLWRNIFLRENKSLKRRVEPDSEPDASPVDALEKEHRGASPASWRLAKLMLRLMAENPDGISVDETRSFCSLEAAGEEVPHPLVLRADAAKIADHITLIGYSKAANTINDAARILMFELSATGKDGQTLAAQRTEGGGLEPMDTEHVNEIIRKLGVIGINGPGVPMTEEEMALGQHRLRFINSHDMVSRHFSRRDRSESSAHGQDIVHFIDGTTRDNGHHEGDALGSGEDEGYVIKDSRARQLLHDALGPKFAPTTDRKPWTEALQPGHGGPANPA